jgi:hypothetical protein
MALSEPIRFFDLSRRVWIVAACAALAGAGGPAAADGPHPRVLFVCRYGAVKSAITRELFLQRARERRISVDASSRALTPEADHLPNALLEAVLAEGIDPRVQPLAALDTADLFDLPASTPPCKRLLDWSDTPSMVQSYPQARRVILERLDGLLDELAAGRMPGALCAAIP